MAHELRRIDPYAHPIVLHSFPWERDKKYNPHLGKKDVLTGISLQTKWYSVSASPAARARTSNA